MIGYKILFKISIRRIYEVKKTFQNSLNSVFLQHLISWLTQFNLMHFENRINISQIHFASQSHHKSM